MLFKEFARISTLATNLKALIKDGELFKGRYMKMLSDNKYPLDGDGKQLISAVSFCFLLYKYPQKHLWENKNSHLLK